MREAWRQSLAEGRVLKINNGETFKSYPTKAETDIALDTLKKAGVKVERLTVKG
jgi:hypothetical protein